MKWLIPLVASVAVAACSTGPGGGYKQPAGTLLGAAGGGLAGAQIGSGTGNLAATASGALLGAAMGSEIGSSLDRADAAYGGRYGPAYYAPPPQPAYAAAPGQIYASPGYAVPGYYGTVTPSLGAPARMGMASGCQRVGNGIWCEQSNGTFRPY